MSAIEGTTCDNCSKDAKESWASLMRLGWLHITRPADNLDFCSKECIAEFYSPHMLTKKDTGSPYR